MYIYTSHTQFGHNKRFYMEIVRVLIDCVSVNNLEAKKWIRYNLMFAQAEL